MNIQELLQKGKEILKDKEDAVLTSKILLAHFLGKDRGYLVINKDENVSKEIEEKYIEAIQKVANDYPLQYITNKQEFMKLNFYVDENVLIPRADTEILVEEIIKLVSKEGQINILDMCSGSGAIGISLAKYITNAKVYMLDISKKALEVAQKNAKLNRVEEQTEFIHSDMFEKVPNIKFDIIVSNPPYIETQVIKTLDKQVLKEPSIALDGGEDGLMFYRILIEESYKFLKQDGIIVLEIGYNQRKEVTKLLDQEGAYKDIYCKKDLGGNDRVVIATQI